MPRLQQQFGASSHPPRLPPPTAHSAGLSRVGPLLEQPLEEFNEVMQTNFIGVVRLTQVRPAGRRM